jgi:hypothetical protein
MSDLELLLLEQEELAYWEWVATLEDDVSLRF